jgi:hypothetical protein
MIINTSDKKVIFIHIPKCGGTSIERSIAHSLFPDDVEMRKEITRNMLNPNLEHPNENYPKIHSRLNNYREYFGADISQFYIFSFVRNPWRRMVSHYEFFLNRRKRISVINYDGNPIILEKSFSNFINNYINFKAPLFFGGYDEFLKDNYGTTLNFVGKLENMENDIKKVDADTGLGIFPVEHKNKTLESLKDHLNWMDYYTPELRDTVYNIWKNDIIKYNYEFEEA